MSHREKRSRSNNSESRDRSKEKSKKTRKSKFDLGSPEQKVEKKPKSSLFTD
jgi:hypothetical protein